jgi:ribonuclease HII
MVARKLKLTKRLRIPKKDYEIALKKQGYCLIAGVDEVGRGSWAGPVVAASVILPEKRIYNLRDSKLLSPQERHKLGNRIIKEAVSYSIQFVSHFQIDTLGLHQATILAYKKALKNMNIRSDFVLVDAYKIPNLSIPHLPIIKGDMKCVSIAAASIIAKVARDNFMIELSKIHPEYDWHNNKGYPSPRHKKALKKLGPTPFHRKSFAPIKRLLDTIGY